MVAETTETTSLPAEDNRPEFECILPYLNNDITHWLDRRVDSVTGDSVRV